MDVAQLVVNAVLVTGLGAVLTFVTRTQIRDIKQDLSKFRTEIKQDLRDLRTEVGVLRSDLTSVALAVGARPRPKTG